MEYLLTFTVAIIALLVRRYVRHRIKAKELRESNNRMIDAYLKCIKELRREPHILPSSEFVNEIQRMRNQKLLQPPQA